MDKRMLQIEVEQAFEATLVSHGKTEEEVMDLLMEYDILVDQLIELTEGKDSAFATDPMGALDYKALTGESSHGMSYNEMAEELGAFAFGE